MFHDWGGTITRNLKVAVIGAGSTYTPEFISGLIIRRHQLQIRQLYLMDIDMEKLHIVGGLAERMIKTSGMDTRVFLTRNLEEAIEGADYVVAQIRVGKLEARIRDEKIPLKYNLLGQETTGAGGLIKALRTIPATMEVAQKIEKLSPHAWFINFSNPSGIIAEAILNHTSVKMMGLCNGPINMIRKAMRMLPEGTQRFDYDFVGLNHLCWLTGIYADGKEILREKLSRGIHPDDLKNIPQANYEPLLLNTVKGLPIAYLNYYYFREEQVELCKKAEKTRGEICVEIENELLEMYKDPNLSEKPAILDKRGGALYSEAAVSLIEAIENDKNEVHVVDVKNNGAYSFMEKDDIVEVKSVVGRKGAAPIALENFDDHYIIGLMRTVKAYEKLACKAGLYGDYEAALAALMVHPLVGDYKKAKGVLDEMLQANREHLPQFYG